MTLENFQIFVLQNAKWFQGVHPESADSIAVAERQLGVDLPASFKWLLMQWGYSAACGVDSLSETVETTLRARKIPGLPHHFVVLNDWQDSGVVLFDTNRANVYGEYPIYWTGEHNLHRLSVGEQMDGDIDSFADYAEGVMYRLSAEKTS